MFKKPEDIKPLPPGMMDAFDKAITSQISEYDKPLDQRAAPQVEAPASEEPESLSEAYHGGKKKKTDMSAEYEADKDHDMDPRSHVIQDKETGMFCVYNMNNKKVAEFKTKEEAEKYAIDNHDALMKKEVVKEESREVDRLENEAATKGAKALTANRDHRQGKAQYKDDNAKSGEEKSKEADDMAKVSGTEIAKEENEAELISQLHEALNADDEDKIKEIIGKLKGASKAHAGQAADLEKAVNEDNTNDMSDDGDGLDKVQPKAVKKKFKDRKDKDIDNDGDVDDSDEYLHTRRKAISKAIAKEAYSKGMIQKAVEVAKKMAGNMTKAVKEIEKMQKGLSKDKAVMSALQSANEEVEK